MPCQQRNMASPKIRWTKVNDGGLIPRPRHGHRAIAVRELMIVFGGGNEGIVDDLHAYNTVSNQWFCPVVKGDVPRGIAAFGLAADNTRLLFHGGMVEYGGYTDALHELQVGPYFATGNISSKWEWKKLKPKAPRFAQAPSPRLGHSFTFISGKFYLFGGLTRDVDPDEVDKGALDIRYSNELYVLEFRGHNCFWEMPHTYGIAPNPRESHTAIGHEDSLGNPKLLIYGGMAGIRLGDIFVLDLSSMTWTQVDVDGPKPLPRSLHTSSVVGEKMYIFGGWVPLDDETAIYQCKWACTDSVARLNLNTYKWEEVELDCPEGCPQPRAGHSAVVVGSRIYIWSGRDGYTRAWDVQVCFKDLWFLEVGKPAVAGKVHLVKAGTKMMELALPEVEFCDHYILQIMPYSVPVSPKTVDTTPVKKKRKFIETDWADDDIGPMLPPTSPLPRVPLPLPPPPKADKPLPLINICDEELPSFLTPPKPPVPPMYVVPPPKPLPRLLPPSPIPPMVQPPQPFMNNSRTVIHHPPPISQHQPFIQHPNLVRTTTPPILTNTVQYVPVQEFTRRFPPPDPNVVRMKNPMVINKPLNTSAPLPTSMYPPTIDLSQMTPVPVKTIPQRATIVKMVNSTLGSFPNIKVQPPTAQTVFSTQAQQVPPPKHTIFINKPVNKPPGQQIVVVSSAPIHRPPQTIQTIQTIARHNDNMFENRNKIVVGNGVKTFPVQQRLPPPAPQRVHVQNPSPVYKEVKVQVNGKTLTVMMPFSTTSVTPVTNTQKRVVCFQPNPTVLTNSSQTKFTVRQETNNPPKQVMVKPCMKVQSANVESRTEGRDSPQKVDEGEKKTSRTVEVIGPKPTVDASSKIIGTPIPSCSGVVTVGSKSSSAAESTSRADDKLKLPDPPSDIKISKVVDGAIISWSPPSKGPEPTGYCINLGVKADDANNKNKITFIKVYADVHTKTLISQEVLERATLSFPKPTIIFRVSSYNEHGFGSSTQVRWLQDPHKNDSSPGQASQTN